MQTISVIIRAVGSIALQVEVFTRSKTTRTVLEHRIEEALGCHTKEGPNFNGGYPYHFLTKTAEVLEGLEPKANWYITYWDTASQPWELRYNRPDRVAAL